MKIALTVDDCIGAGQCVVAAPAVFGQNDEDGLVYLHRETADPADEPAVRQAARRCPARAIHVED